MANEFLLDVEGKTFWGQNNRRFFKVYFSLPDDEVISNKKNIGMLFLAAGFGGEANAKVYRKMRKQFADEYGLVVV